MMTRTSTWMTLVRWLPVILVGILLGAAVPLLAPTLSLPAILLLPGAVALGFGLMLSGPAGCIGAIAALATLGGLSLTAEVGPADLQLADVFYAALVLWVIAHRPTEAAGTAAPIAPAVGIPTAGVLVFVAYIGVTVLEVAFVDPRHLEISLVSWLRLVQTASLIWLTATAVRTTRDVRRVIEIVALACVAAIIIALAQAVQARPQFILHDRFGGLLNVNSLGLVSGLVILLSFSARLGRTWRARFALASIGVVGLILSKSVGATIGVALVLGIAHGLRQRGAGIDRLVKLMLITGLSLFVALALIRVSRPEVLPTSSQFRLSSATHRTVVAAAGWEIFAREPLTGVGWQRSSSPAVIGAGELAAALRDRFPGVNPSFFPDVSPTSVHNAYVQILAELGLIGFALFTLAISRSSIGIRRLLRRTSADNVLTPYVRFAALGLLLILIWWNDNPIFGGQVETVLAAVFLGILISVGRYATEGTRSSPPLPVGPAA
jgi:O-antigen ligase